MEEKVKEWVKQEGYPLEFLTAHAFKKNNFSVEQGYFAKDTTGKVREVDVLATRNFPVGRSFVRIKHVVECKWSKDKPWVLFKDDKRYQSSALAAQLITSTAGQAISWLSAGEESLKELEMFKGEDLFFSGRQTFTKNSDVFYQAVQGVVSNCISISRSYDSYDFRPDEHMLAVIALPVVVVDGELFEASYAEASHDVLINRISHARLRWKGHEGRSLNTIVDIVTSDYLDQFLRKRNLEVDILAGQLKQSLDQLIKCFNEKTEKYLRVTPAPRGVYGLPSVLMQLKKVCLPSTL